MPLALFTLGINIRLGWSIHKWSVETDTCILISPETWHFKATFNQPHGILVLAKWLNDRWVGGLGSIWTDWYLHYNCSVVASSNVVWMIRSQNVFSSDDLWSDHQRLNIRCKQDLYDHLKKKKGEYAALPKPINMLKISSLYGPHIFCLLDVV